VNVTRATLIVALLLYVFLWVLAFSGASGLVEPLLIPLVLGVMIALGVALTRFVGLPPRKQHFGDRDEEGKS
jgi:fatty acid desaturase